MQKIRAELDFDRSTDSEPASHRTETKTSEARCGMCGDRIFVEPSTIERLSKAVEQGLEENPLLCRRCESDFQDTSAGE